MVEPEAISIAGDSLFPLELPLETAEKLKNDWEKAYVNYQLDSKQIDNIIWFGRRTAYLQDYREAIKIYSEGLELYPDSARLLRHRGHRYITIRKFDLAVKDLTKAASLLSDTIPRTEPDGMPNKLNLPLGNTQFNIYYHLGLAHYLLGDFDRAVQAYESCLNYSINDDLLVATLDWMYMTLHRTGRQLEADNLLELVHTDMNIIENNSYHQRLLMYKGLLEPDSLLKVSEEAEDRSLVLATQGYGVGNWHLRQGDTALAVAMFQRVIQTGNWPAFGYIAAETDLFKLKPK
jgi:tetratricopeptide (TPR) repeat protein